jgi:L-ascorbate metabolism protein UlaG (beta-lactamase superfamily)
MSIVGRIGFLLALLVHAALSSSAIAASPASVQKFCLTYLGNAGWQIQDESKVILVDPYLSQFREARATSPNVEGGDDLVVADQHGIDAHIKRADFILATHSHVDHMLDAPYIAIKTGATIIGSATSIAIARANHVPEKQLITIKGGEDYQFKGLSVRVIPSLHTALWGKRYGNTVWAGIAAGEIVAPLHESAYVEGGSFAYLVRMAGHKILVSGTMNYIEREMQGLSPDIAIVGAGESRAEIFNYASRLMRALNEPPFVLPTHWDSWASKTEAQALKGVSEFATEIRAASPHTKVFVPKYFEAFSLGAGSNSVTACNLTAAP